MYGYPNIFNNYEAYRSFRGYVNKHIIDPYIDHSYLFQPMLKDGYIHNMKHKDYMFWLREAEIIPEKWLDEFMAKENFRSLSKSNLANRANNLQFDTSKFRVRYSEFDIRKRINFVDPLISKFRVKAAIFNLMLRHSEFGIRSSIFVSGLTSLIL